MTLNRRKFLTMVSVGMAASMAGVSVSAHASDRRNIKAVAFDAFPIFDPRPIFQLAEYLYPGQGKALGAAWRDRQFEYQWLRALSGQYTDFWKATEDGLLFAARELKLNMNKQQRKQLMEAYLNLKPWPDVVPALERLKAEDIRLVFLSNMTPTMLKTNARNSDLLPYFDHIISTDKAKTYKPDPKAYQLGVDTLKLRREEIAFAAFAGWDVAGAKWYGYPTFWVNRAGFLKEELDVSADETGNNLNQLVDFVLRKQGRSLGEDK